ncbi:MAG: restriction endonuclease subunit S [Muribaculaceae bacterium]|nr:restriction endonuclease subunit S [Muribaculaceae bacterium]
MIETKFKQTELGPIPEDWDVIALNEIGSFSKGSGISRDDSHSGFLPAIRYGEIYTTHHNYIVKYTSHISKEIADASKQIQGGEILFTASGETKEEIGKAVATPEGVTAYAGGDLIILTPKDGFNSRYLGFISNSEYSVKQKSSLGQGDAVVHISASKLSHVKIPIPCIKEQEKIAEALCGIDTLIRELDALIGKKRAVMQGSIQELLSARHRLSGFSIPWKHIIFGDTVNIYRGGSPRPIENFITTNPNGLNWIKIGDVRPKDKYIAQTAEKIIPEGLSSTREVHVGDFILSNSMSFGRPYILKIDGCIHDGWLAITNYENTFDKDYLYYLLGSDSVYKQYLSLAAGSGVLNLNKKLVAAVELDIPDIEEQQAIAAILSDMDAEITELEAKREKYAAIRQGMMQQLLTGKIRLI